MYMNRMVEIGKASNGYVIECRVPIKAKDKENGKDMVEAYPGSTEKQYIAKDLAEVIDIVGKLMPMLDDTFTSEDQFDLAFKEASK